jgi:glucosamine--fructose-6-phosphate aminotransferase (isomerizing)
VKTVHAHTGAAELGPYRHYMQKEIFEQPRVIGDTLEGVTGIMPELFGDGAYKVFKQIDRVLILACGTSYYAGLTAKYWIESVAKMPVNVEIASEYRYRDSVPHPNTLVVTISQSRAKPPTPGRAEARAQPGHGAHADHLQRCHQRHGARMQAAYITRAGVEVGVASTKAFTTQLAALFLLTLTLAQVNGRLTDEEEADT